MFLGSPYLDKWLISQHLCGELGHYPQESRLTFVIVHIFTHMSFAPGKCIPCSSGKGEAGEYHNTYKTNKIILTLRN